MVELKSSLDILENPTGATRGKMRKIDLAYLAGFFDGEGSCGLYTTKGRIQPDGSRQEYFYSRVSIGNTDREIPALCKEIFGGGLSTEQPLKGLIVYRWNATGENANNFLRQIVHYLKQKKVRAKLLLEYYTKRKMLSWEDKEKIRMKFIALNGMSGKSHRPQRLSEKTPQGDAIV